MQSASYYQSVWFQSMQMSSRSDWLKLQAASWRFGRQKQIHAELWTPQASHRRCCSGALVKVQYGLLGCLFVKLLEIWAFLRKRKKNTYPCIFSRSKQAQKRKSNRCWWSSKSTKLPTIQHCRAVDGSQKTSWQWCHVMHKSIMLKEWNSVIIYFKQREKT